MACLFNLGSLFGKQVRSTKVINESHNFWPIVSQDNDVPLTFAVDTSKQISTITVVWLLLVEKGL